MHYHHHVVISCIVTEHLMDNIAYLWCLQLITYAVPLGGACGPSFGHGPMVKND